jgi:hypothetical protein
MRTGVEMEGSKIHMDGSLIDADASKDSVVKASPELIDQLRHSYGAAWGDGTPIKKVHFKVDDDKWKNAVIDKEPSEKYCWKFFSIDLGLYPSGKHSLVSRAIDANDRIQPSSVEDEIALKKTYWEANQQWVREVEIGD